MAKTHTSPSVPYSSSLPINPKLAIDVQSIPGLFNTNCTINYNAIGTVFKIINSIPGIKVNDLKLNDLMFPAYYCNGVYLFYDPNSALLSHPNLTKKSQNPNKIVYIGKAGGRTFIERIAAHFAPRAKDYMNNMLKNMAMLLFSAKTDKDIDLCFPIAKEFYLKIIYFPSYCPNVNNCIEQLEKELIKYYGKPILNKR